MSTNPYQAALSTLQRCTEALSTATAAERAQLLKEQTEAVRILEQSSARRRLSTQTLVTSVATLERRLSELTPGERRIAICERLGISPSYFYRLRSLAESTNL